MKDERVSSIRIDEPIFCASPKTDDQSSCKALPKVDRERPPEIRPPRLDIGNPPPLKHSLKAADGRLNFGKLGHARDMA
jgi:hypothetical protein